MCILFHRWGKWQVIKHGPLVETKWVNGQKVRLEIGSYLTQRRVCEKCGKSELNQQEVV